ncbi:hypothetical protein D3C85_1454660 [compost metagenome]
MLSVWPTTLALTSWCWPRVCATWSSTERNDGLMVALSVSKVTWLGMLTLSVPSGCSVIWVPVPAVSLFSLPRMAFQL